MNILQKIWRNKAWMAVALMLVILIIFSATGFIQTTLGTWIMAGLFFAAIIYVLGYWFKWFKSKK